MTFSQSQPTCFLHIGPHKTGSSSIQGYLRANAEALARAGLVYPRLPQGDGKLDPLHKTLMSDEEIFGAGADGDALSPAWQAVHDVIADGRPDLVISSEIFAFKLRNRRKLDSILGFFERRGYAVRIIAYVRDQPGWLNSWYVQAHKRFIRNCSILDYVRQESASGRVDPWWYLETLIDHPRLSLDVVSFEAACRSGLEVDFVRRCGITERADLVAPQFVNPNAGAKTVHAAKLIMAEKPVNLRLHPGYGVIFSAFKRAYTRLDWHETPYMGLDQDMYDEVRAQYRERNDRFAQRFFGTSWTELSPDRACRRRVFEMDMADRRELAEIRAVVGKVLRVIDEHSAAAGEQPVVDAGLRRKRRAEKRAKRALAAAGQAGAA